MLVCSVCCYSYYHVANSSQLVKAVFVSNTVSELLDTVCFVSVCTFSDFLL